MGKFLVIFSLLHSARPKWVGLIEQDAYGIDADAVELAA